MCALSRRDVRKGGVPPSKRQHQQSKKSTCAFDMAEKTRKDSAERKFRQLVNWFGSQSKVHTNCRRFVHDIIDQKNHSASPVIPDKLVFLPISVKIFRKIFENISSKLFAAKSPAHRAPPPPPTCFSSSRRKKKQKKTQKSKSRHKGNNYKKNKLAHTTNVATFFCL